MTDPNISRWNYYPIIPEEKLVRLEPYRTKAECQALGVEWDGIHGAELREILAQNKQPYKFLPSTRVDRRGGYRGTRVEKPKIETKQILISIAAHNKLTTIFESNPTGTSLREILSNLILSVKPGLQVTARPSQKTQSARVTVEAHAKLAEILKQYPKNSGYTNLAAVDAILGI